MEFTSLIAVAVTLRMGQLQSVDGVINVLLTSPATFGALDPSVSQALGDRLLPAIYPVHSCNSSEKQEGDNCAEICDNRTAWNVKLSTRSPVFWDGLIMNVTFSFTPTKVMNTVKFRVDTFIVLSGRSFPISGFVFDFCSLLHCPLPPKKQVVGTELIRFNGNIRKWSGHGKLTWTLRDQDDVPAICVSFLYEII